MYIRLIYHHGQLHRGYVRLMDDTGEDFLVKGFTALIKRGL